MQQMGEVLLLIYFASQGSDCSTRVCVPDIDCFNGANCTVAGGATVICSCTAGFTGSNCRVATTTTTTATSSDIPVGIVVGVVVAVVVIGAVIGVLVFAYHKHAARSFAAQKNAQLKADYVRMA